MRKLNILSLTEAKNLSVQRWPSECLIKFWHFFVNPYVFQVHVYISEKRITENTVTESWRITELRTGT